MMKVIAGFGLSFFAGLLLFIALGYIFGWSIG